MFRNYLRNAPAGPRPSLHASTLPDADGPAADRSARSAQATGDSDGSTVVRVEGLSKTFGEGEAAITAVDDVSFTIERGEIVGLLGPNGAGKTTTIKSMLGLVTPDEGSVEIEGIDVYERPRAAYEYVEAMMEGARNQYWRLTVRENLEYFAAIAGEDPAAIRDRHDRLLDALDLREFEDEQVRNLSRGMKQKVSIASTLARDVDVVFLDEPTLGLDVESSITLRRSLRDLAEERELTVVVTSHDMDAIEDVCGRVVVMDDGEVIADDRVDALLESFDASGYRVTVRGVDAASIRALDRTVGLDDVTELDGRVRIEVTADSESFYGLMAELESMGARLDDVETTTPDLEEAFVTMTGGERR